MTQRRIIPPSTTSATSELVTVTIFLSAVMPLQNAEPVIPSTNAIGHEAEIRPKLVQKLAGNSGNCFTSLTEAPVIGQCIIDTQGQKRQDRWRLDRRTCGMNRNDGSQGQ